jgi:DNA polymerase-3 subunit beta
MKIIAIRAGLLRELTALASVAEKKATLPILANVHLDAALPSDLTLRATDLDIWLSTPLTVEVVAPGAACLPVKRLLEIVKALPEAEITIEVTEQRATITCQKSRFVLATTDPDSFPEMPNLKTESTVVEVPGQILREMISHVQCAISQEESRYMLNGAKLEAKNGRLRLVATDGHRMSQAVVTPDQPAIAPDIAMDVLVPRKALAEIARLIDTATDLVRIEQLTQDGRLVVRTNKTSRVLVTRLLAGQFPNVDAIPQPGADAAAAIPGAPAGDSGSAGGADGGPSVSRTTAGAATESDQRLGVNRERRRARAH